MSNTRESASDSAERICPNCGATVGPSATTCWLCEQELSPGAASQAARPADQPTTVFGSVTALVIAVAWILVTIGAFGVAPGLGVLLAIIAVPVAIRAIVVIRKRETRGQNTSPVEKILLYGASFVVVCVLLAVTAVAAFLTFCATCIAAAGLSGSLVSGNDASMTASMIIGSSAALSVSVGLMFLFWKLMRRLYGRKGEHRD